MPKTKTKSDPAALRTLIRIARSAYLSADDLLLRSAELELDAYGIQLSDLGIDQVTSDEPEVDRG